jgi:ATP-dependent Clp protease ATP-binding subunit ClpC
MFERYKENSRKAISFAWYEASQTGSEHIETEHLLLGLLRTNEALAHRLLAPPENIESIRQQIYKRIPLREKISTSVDLPLSDECKRILAYGAEEAERRNTRYVEPEHLVFGPLREEKCLAARIMLERGVLLSLLKDEKAGPPVKSSSRPDDFRDLTAEARNGSLGPLIGREHENGARPSDSLAPHQEQRGPGGRIRRGEKRDRRRFVATDCRRCSRSASG